MKRKLLLMFVFLTVYSYSQQNFNQNKIVPPSPNAASLGQYADVPVSNYTGIPGISIPLFNINSGKIELPITASYHASGIKVAQEASLVGLGWALNAGGAITRQVRGFDDFSLGGYISRPIPPSTTDNLADLSGNNLQLYINTYYPLLNSSDLSIRIDGEPDIFYYNFMGYSGKLVFLQQAYSNGFKAISIDQNNLIFSYNAGQWVVTDGKGWKYYLGRNDLHATEKTESYTYSATSPIQNVNPDIYNNRMLNLYADSNTENVDTAWYITKVLTPEGDTMEFLYDQTQYETLGQLNYSDRFNKLKSTSIVSGTGSITLPQNNPDTDLYTVSQQKVSDVYLKKIKFKNGTLEFVTNDRDDLRRTNSYYSKPQKLKSIELFDLSLKSIKKVEFNYSYFNENQSANYLRLRLDSIGESFKKGIDYLKKPCYVFSYNQTALPDKCSYSIDHWGYFNGRDNDNIPDKYYNFSYTGSPIGLDNSLANNFLRPKKMLSPAYKDSDASSLSYLMGADRDVNTFVMQAATLEKIKYPTGATVDFSYEPNDYFDENNILYELSLEGSSAFSEMYGDPQNAQSTFTITESTLVYIDFNVNNSSTNFNYNNQQSFTGEAALKKLNGNSILFLSSVIRLDQSGTYTNSASVVLAPGTYQLNTNYGDDSSLSVYIGVHYYKKTPIFKKIGAGIRINTITTKDNDLAIKQKKYTYEINGKSTGRLLSPITYGYSQPLVTTAGATEGLGFKFTTWYMNYLIRTSESMSPLGNSAQGNAIGYNEVVVTDTDFNNNKLGSSKYNYMNVADIRPVSFIPGIPNIINENNGKLLKETYFNNQGDTVFKKQISYKLDQASRKLIKGVKIFKYPNFTNSPPQAFDYFKDKTARFYDIYSDWWVTSSVAETTYDTKGLNPICMTTSFKYDNPLHKNLTETQTTNSKGQQISTTNQYPSDQPTGTGMTTGDFNLMIAQNIIDPVIKQQTKINNNILSTQVSTYKDWNLDINGDNIPDDIFLPENVKTAKEANLLELRTQNHSYYPDGNVQEMSKADGSHVVYIWGYKNEYPVAMIENATFSEVSSYVTGLQNKSNLDIDHCLDTEVCKEKELRDALNSLRTDAIYKNKWQVTAYTYDPLIGVTSITDPKGYIIYYLYDSFGRLEFVKDAQGNILSENKYNYRPN